VIRDVSDARLVIKKVSIKRRIQESRSVRLVTKNGNEFEIPLSDYTDSAALTAQLKAFLEGNDDRFDFAVAQPWVAVFAVLPLVIKVRMS
jgi:hypothetical protein